MGYTVANNSGILMTDNSFVSQVKDDYSIRSNEKQPALARISTKMLTEKFALDLEKN